MCLKNNDCWQHSRFSDYIKILWALKHFLLQYHEEMSKNVPKHGFCNNQIKPRGRIRTAPTPENTVRVQAIISGSPRQSACSHSAAL